MRGRSRIEIPDDLDEATKAAGAQWPQGRWLQIITQTVGCAPTCSFFARCASAKRMMSVASGFGQGGVGIELITPILSNLRGCWGGHHHRKGAREAWRRHAPSFTDCKGSLEHDPDMATTRMEVRQLTGKLLPEFCFDDLPDSRLPVDQFSAIARRELQMMRDEGGQLTAFGVHFFRGSDEIGSWSLDRERADTARI